MADRLKRLPPYLFGKINKLKYQKRVAGIDVIRLHGALERSGIACATPDGTLRFAPHWANHVAEVVQVVRAVDRALADR